jgi:uncharacterized DUF497 family protein
MLGAGINFDWDASNIEKCRKHGVSIEDIEFVLSHPLSLRADLDHSQSEERQQAVGRTRSGRHVFVVFTMRQRTGQLHVRPISARYMHRKEIGRYEKDAD